MTCFSSITTFVFVFPPLGPRGEHQAPADPQTVHAVAVTTETAVAPALTVSLRESGTGSARIEIGTGTEWSETGLQTEIESGIVGIPELQIEPQSGEEAANREARGKSEKKSVMLRVKESEAVGRSETTKSVPVVESEKGSAQKIREPKGKEMNSATRMSGRRKGTGRLVRASGQAKAGAERGGTKMNGRARNVLGHAPGVVKN